MTKGVAIKMKTYTQEELDIIIANHKHWFYEDCEGWENMKGDLSNADLSDVKLKNADLSNADLRCANLSNADLSNTNLYGVDLRCADLCNANLSNADLRNTDLSDVKLKNANLYSANLSCANLSCVNLSNTILYGADLSYANLCSANLSNADLRYVNLRRANLIHANLKGANLAYTNLKRANLAYTNLKSADLINAEHAPFIPYSCPETGSFIGYKKASNYIVELEILADSRRCSATGRKCRCDKARVLSIQNIDKNEPCNLKEVASDYNKNFIYKVGEIVEEPNFNEDRWSECSPGIHFFINRQEAVEY